MNGLQLSKSCDIQRTTNSLPRHEICYFAHGELFSIFMHSYGNKCFYFETFLQMYIVSNLFLTEKYQ